MCEGIDNMNFVEFTSAMIVFQKTAYTCNGLVRVVTKLVLAKGFQVYSNEIQRLKWQTMAPFSTKCSTHYPWVNEINWRRRHMLIWPAKNLLNLPSIVLHLSSSANNLTYVTFFHSYLTWFDASLGQQKMNCKFQDSWIPGVLEVIKIDQCLKNIRLNYKYKYGKKCSRVQQKDFFQHCSIHDPSR
jgi:hypothetical protein